MTSKWIQVDPTTLDRPKKERVDGVEITVLMSPYDIPEAVRGFYDAELGRFVIELRYVAEEELRNENREHLSLRLGKNSGRLYGVELDVDALKAQWVQLVTKALRDREDKPRRLKNYEVAQEILRQKEPELLEAMAV